MESATISPDAIPNRKLFAEKSGEPQESIRTRMQIPKPSSAMPQLLVSVQNAHEAKRALAGGCDLLDVKDPSRGSLGMAGRDAIATVVRVAARVPADGTRVPVSVALGEIVDWLDRPVAVKLPRGLDYAKLGTAGIKRDREWIRNWSSVRQMFEAMAEAPFHWIAVAYADWKEAAAPEPKAVVEAAAAAGCHGVLIDTHGKSGRTLTDDLVGKELEQIAVQVRKAGMVLALAGQLRADCLPSLAPAEPDILAIRTAGCRGRQRSGPICTDAVWAFREAIRETFGHPILLRSQRETPAASSASE
jgi:hypothetical protein